MKIVDARVIVTCPGRNFVTLKLVTDEGLHGHASSWHKRVDFLNKHYKSTLGSRKV